MPAAWVSARRQPVHEDVGLRVAVRDGKPFEVDADLESELHEGNASSKCAQGPGGVPTKARNSRTLVALAVAPVPLRSPGYRLILLHRWSVGVLEPK